MRRSLSLAVPLYPGHQPTSAPTKGFIALFSAFKALHNPHRADAVAALGEATGRRALGRLRDQLRASPSGRRILDERPVIDRASIAEAQLDLLGPETFGGCYARYLEQHSFDPEERDRVR